MPDAKRVQQEDYNQGRPGWIKSVLQASKHSRLASKSAAKPLNVAAPLLPLKAYGVAPLFFEGVLQVIDYSFDFLRAQIESRHRGATLADRIGYLFFGVTLPKLWFIEVSRMLI